MPRTTSPGPLRVAVDTGGTFTDCVWYDAQQRRLRMLKVFSTPGDPSQAIAEVIAKTGHAGPVTLLHGTTVGTNSLLQRKGGRVAFVTTKGFEDSIQIGRQARPKLYDFFFDAIEPLVPAELRFGIAERTDKDGKVLQSPSTEQLSSLVAAVRTARPEAIAVSLLFCFANPENERTVAEALQPLGIPLSLAHEILPEFREYERASTVVVNAYLQPVMQRYLERLRSRVRGRTFVMQSSGGLASLELATREPVRTVLSGPAGGVIGAALVGERSGFERIIGFDMGGTSTDVCLVDGVPQTTNEAEVAGLPVRVPMLNIHTVGAGGGSLARFDAAGALRVGPESAGADPGPICYGRGVQPTVTDANLLLGRLLQDRFLGGEFQLDAERTRRITAEWLRNQRVGMTLEAFVEGVVRVVNSTMEKAIRLVSIEKGYDPREFTLVAFGGAGALHACELAAALDIPRVLVPYMPGALSAIGILASDVVKDFSRTLLIASKGKLPDNILRAEFRKLEQRATREFAEEQWSGQVHFQRSLDLRYKGQGFELQLPYTRTSLAAFHQEHQRRYGYSQPQREVEVVTVRLRAWIATPPLPRTNPAGPAKHIKNEFRKVFFGGRPIKTLILDRDSVGQRKSFKGPAIITEYSATTVVPRAWKVSGDAAGNLILSRN